MKLCRFELISEPGVPRSGMIYSGKIYETDGAEAKGVHEASAVRPLTPVGHPPSLRIFRNPTRLGEELNMDDLESLPFQYSNPASIIGSNQAVLPPGYVNDLQCEPYLVGVVASPGLNIPVEAADDVLLGLTIMNLFVARDLIRRSESCRAFDFISAIGPVLTTPDELDAYITTHEFGKRFNLTTIIRVNGVERRRAQTVDLPITLAQAVAHCSEGPPLASGDLVAVGPISMWEDDEPPIEIGDEVQVAIESLGTLSTKIASPTAHDFPA